MSAKLRPLAPQDIIAFFEAKGIGDAGCQACGHKGFSLLDETLHNSRMCFFACKFPGHDLGGSDVIEFVALTCDNCATTRLYARGPIAEWVDAKLGESA